MSFEALVLFKKTLSENDIRSIDTYHILGFICFESKEYDLSIEYLD